jgi:FkbM family methyltransferase
MSPNGSGNGKDQRRKPLVANHMIRPRKLTQSIKALLRSWGIKIERYDLSSSHDLRLARMLAANSIDLVIDVGASRGEYALALQSHGYKGRILSFEPLRSAYTVLVERSQGNRSWQAADRMALGDTNGTVVMNIAANSTSSSVLDMLDRHRMAAPTSAYIATEEADVRRLDGIDHPFISEAAATFLKIDTQGYESHVLAGAAGYVGRIRGLQMELSL